MNKPSNNPQPVDAALRRASARSPLSCSCPHRPSAVDIADRRSLGRRYHRSRRRPAWPAGDSQHVEFHPAGASRQPHRAPRSGQGSAISAMRRSIRSTSWTVLAGSKFYHKVHEAGAVPLTAGGDHLVTLPIFRAIAKQHPLAWSFRRTFGYERSLLRRQQVYPRYALPARGGGGLLDPKRSCRSASEARSTARMTWPSPKAAACGSSTWRIQPDRPCGGRRRSAAGRRQWAYNLYRFDVDGLDPVFAPGTGTPRSAA